MASDDEDFFEEFDDDDIFWVEESDPTAADDLAAAATHDPILPEDPSLETADYFSDWDDLSDDYYDEDPTAVRRLRAMGLLPLKDTAPFDSLPSKRRKVANNLITDTASFQGVAWKHPADETDIVEIYAPGEGEKVSLLKNWREIFRNAKPAIGRLRGRKPIPMMVDVNPAEESEPGLEVPPLVEDISDAEVTDADAKSAKPLYSTPFHAQVVLNSPPDLPVHSKKLGFAKSPGDELKHPLQPITEEDQGPTTNGVSSETPAEDGTKEPAPAPARRGRKRKASVSVSDPPDDSQNTATTEAQPKKSKRSLSKSSQTSKPPPASSAPVRRSARNKK
ncbi:hypothetical protein ASPCAL04134 [Aspergillus calidoustus]|uniref:Uncharacterized protein n=1 Tax=Aspergillus calidoustus TaxID=454130 RepID=A0A0U5FWG1_ASPCI|nr:hypothetical protein ASPCAL04134 [Aspergillus calidoustus]